MRIIRIFNRKNTNNWRQFQSTILNQRHFFSNNEKVNGSEEINTTKNVESTQNDKEKEVTEDAMIDGVIRKIKEVEIDLYIYIYIYIR